MINDVIIQLLCDIVGVSGISLNEPMYRHTTFRIGGNADIMIEPSDTRQTEGVIKTLKQMNIPYIILGNGSNVLVGDNGIRGAVVKIGNKFSNHNTDGCRIYADAGIKLSRLANIALGNHLSGLEFAAGIPGTLGGAVYMNAGAYDGEMKQIVREVTYLNEKGECCKIQGFDCEFGYRTSIFEKNPQYVILGCEIELTEGNPDDIKALMDDLADRRNSKQPLNLPSAGSTFKRPEGYFAGKLIQDAGLMGYSIGGAAVSEKHAGFVVNNNNATAADVCELIKHVQEKVYNEFNVKLSPEVRFIGEF